MQIRDEFCIFTVLKIKLIASLSQSSITVFTEIAPGCLRSEVLKPGQEITFTTDFTGTVSLFLRE
jgi:hypothetical protein